MRRRLILVLILLAAAGGTWAIFEFVVWNAIPADLVGKWVVVGGPQDGAVFDFHRNGTTVGKINLGGKEGVVRAQVRVQDGKLYWTTRSQTGVEDTRVKNLRTLNAKELVWEESKSETLRMERAE